MKVLCVCPFVPWPLDSGGRIRTLNLLREVRRNTPDFEVELWCVADERPVAPLEAALLRELGDVRLFARSVEGPWRRFARAKYERWFASHELERALAQRFATAPPDLVHVDEMSVLRAVPDPAPCPLVVHHSKLDLEFHDRVRGRSASARFDRAKIARLESLAARRARHQIVCSVGDRERLRSRHPELDVTVVPSGYDGTHLRPDRTFARRPGRILFLGSLDYEPNEDGLEFLVRDVLPRLASDASVAVVGRDPSPRVRALCGGRVELVGPVDDVRESLLRASLLVAPLRIGGGTRLKIAEALAVETPVVSTRIGAEGLDLDERHLWLADDPAEFAAAIDEVLADPTAAAVRARAGHAEVARRLTWPRLAEVLVEAWRRASSAG